MPPIFKGINPFKWGSDIRQYISDQNDVGKEKSYRYQKRDPGKLIGGDFKAQESKNCNCVFPSRYHQIDCPHFRSSCPVHSRSEEYSEPTVTISFRPGDGAHKLLDPIKSILTSTSKRIKLKYYLPASESDTEILKKPLISGPEGSHRRYKKIKDDSDVEKREKFLRSFSPDKLRDSDFITVTKEKGNKINHEIYELNKGVKNEPHVYYTVTSPPKGKKASNNNIEKKIENVCTKKNCPCTKDEGLKKVEEESNPSIYFTPYMLLNDDDSPIKDNKKCCSCMEINSEKKCSLRKRSGSKINVNFHFNGKDFEMSNKKNLIQVLLPETHDSQEDIQIKEESCPCAVDDDVPSNKFPEKLYQQPKEQNAIQMHVPVVRESKPSKFAETQTETVPAIVQCPVCSGKNMKEEAKIQNRLRPGRTESNSPVKPKPRTHIPRMNLDEFQAKKKQAWEKQEHDLQQSSRLGSDGYSTDPEYSEYSTTETEGRMKCIAFDCPRNCQPCRGYQVYVAKTPEPNNAALRNIFPFYNENYFPKQRNDKKGLEKTIGDFDDLLQLISEKFSKNNKDEEEIKNSESLNHFENENNFIDIIQYRQARKAEKKNSVRNMLNLPLISVAEKVAESTDRDYRSQTNVSEEIQKKDSIEKYTMTSDVEKKISDDEMVTLQIKVSKNKS